MTALIAAKTNGYGPILFSPSQVKFIRSDASGFAVIVWASGQELVTSTPMRKLTVAFAKGKKS